MSNRYWLAQYPEGAPTEIDPTRHRSIGELIEEACAKFATRPAFVCMGQSMSYGELSARARDLAAYFQSLGLKSGDRVALMMPNVLQYPIATLAVLKAGLIAVNVNPLYTARELEHQLKDSGARAIVILENFNSALAEALPNLPAMHVIVTGAGDLLGAVKGTFVNLAVRYKTKPARIGNATSFSAALKAGAAHSFVAPAIAHEDVAVLQYTGGTTGVSKGAMLTHRALIAAILSSEGWMQPVMGKAKVDSLVFACALPIYHVFAFVNCVMIALRAGGLCVLIPNPRDIKGMTKALQPYPLHIFPAVNTLFNALAHSPEFAKLDFSHLLISLGGGMAMQESVAKAWQKLTGCPITEGYGLSETCAGVVCNPFRQPYNGTCGVPMANVDIRIIDDEGRDVAQGERGEIAIAGPQLMSGYWNRPDDTAAAMTADGFFKTGDIGVMDERGYLTIVDRKKDMILVSGFNVYPNEIEDVIASHPGVLECAAVGVPDEHSGEAVTLFVVKKDPSLTKEQIIAHARHDLTGYKTPRRVEFRASLPKTNVGKILRRELRDEAVRDTAADAKR
ncbi:MAG: AMP-binding protein [Hyphomicrobiales bacterium]|nr:AMP-binding protein [Hyphomicrobiales bacterium]